MRHGLLTKSDNVNLQELCQKIIKGCYNTPAHLSAEAKDLLSRMLTVVPDHRITFEQVSTLQDMTLQRPSSGALVASCNQAANVTVSCTWSDEHVHGGGDYRAAVMLA